MPTETDMTKQEATVKIAEIVAKAMTTLREAEDLADKYELAFCVNIGGWYNNPDRDEPDYDPEDDPEGEWKNGWWQSSSIGC